MITSQILLNIVFAAVTAYLLRVVWNQQTQIKALSGQHSQVSLEQNNGVTSNEDQGLTITSVWCHHGNNRLCQFKNICYNSDEDEFVMFKSRDSVLENVQFTDSSLRLDMSSVREHNTMETTITSLPSEFSAKFRMAWVNVRTLAFKRFLPDNLMHMFHDDILPLYDTLKYLNFGSNRNKTDPFKMQLVVFNDTEEDLDEEIDTLYQRLSVYRIKFKKDLKLENSLTCFRDLTLGLSTRTTWYDYGFMSPQCPLTDTKLTNKHIQEVVDFIQHNVDLSTEMSHGDYIVLLARRETRRILNEMELSLEVTRTTRLKVVVLSLDTHSLFEIITSVRHCKGVIGMHGSLLILSLFLQPHSFLIELFPYAVNPDKYTPYKTLCNTREKDYVVYAAWTNQKLEHSFGHPDWSSEMGGIDHLDEEERETILSQTEVPPHICCSDPSWLYHIYQDTMVDVTEVTSLVLSSLQKLQHIQTEEERFQTDSYPSKVKGVKCNIVSTDINLSQNPTVPNYIHITFTAPWTVDLSQENIETTYEILIQNISSDEQTVLNHKTKTHSLTLEVDSKGMYVVWVRCVIGSVNVGPYSDSVYCI